VSEWHTVTADTVSTYVFTGLDPLRIKARVIQLRLEPFTLNSSISDADVDRHWLNDRAILSTVATRNTGASIEMVHTIDIPTSVIAEDGTLRLTIQNRNR